MPVQLTMLCAWSGMQGEGKQAKGKDDEMGERKLTRRVFLQQVGMFSAAAVATQLIPAGGMARKAFAGIPDIRFGYLLSDHHAPFLVLARNWELFQQRYNIYMKPVVEEKLYDFVYDGATVARIQLIPAKLGNDIEKIAAQGDIDVAIIGTRGIMLCIDSGVGTRLVSPLQTAGCLFVVRKDLPMAGWGDFVRATKGAGKGFRIGMPSASNVAAIIFKSALESEGISYTEDATQKKADVLFVSMKGHGNIVACLTNDIADGIIGAEPFCSLTINKGAGKFIINLQDAPPNNKWRGHTCCSVMGMDDFMTRDRELAVQLMELIVLGVEVTNADKTMCAKTCASWLGVEEAVEQSALQNLNFTTVPSSQWVESVHVYAETIDELKMFKGKLAGKRNKELDDLVFDFRSLDEAKKRLAQKKYIA